MYPVCHGMLLYFLCIFKYLLPSIYINNRSSTKLAGGGQQWNQP